MKRLLILISSLSISSFALAGGIENVPAQPPAPYFEGGPYLGIHGGAVFPSTDHHWNDLDTGFDVGAQLGYRFNPHFRVEGAFTYLNNDFNFTHRHRRWHHNNLNGSLNSYLFMANAFYDFSLNSVIDPFIGAGIGLVHFSGSFGNHNFNFDNDGDTNEFAYQAIAGIGFNVMPNLMLSARYRFVGTTDDVNYNIAEGSVDYFF